ncbi:hypothetical protein BO78DRAFT_52060 [Aspergillus sclerotiicarbonarius CBS 121057]|uniref:Uncharacterized protein n=1 Tax=Aspergillus sclerotiicarbonarius (strain CBS 121057 / IBT 28362) TaxID=1448318 RepID=A0A319EWX1_ASPSB|nr:hypothetical protein BO78DRAFT_52060 [Aspergillus sclerotiicarbonarius CBS 121057]
MADARMYVGRDSCGRGSRSTAPVCNHGGTIGAPRDTGHGGIHCVPPRPNPARAYASRVVAAETKPSQRRGPHARIALSGLAGVFATSERASRRPSMSRYGMMIGASMPTHAGGESRLNRDSGLPSWGHLRGRLHRQSAPAHPTGPAARPITAGAPPQYRLRQPGDEVRVAWPLITQLRCPSARLCSVSNSRWAKADTSHPACPIR